MVHNRWIVGSQMNYGITNKRTGAARPQVAVVGAGISGLMCARVLIDQGYPVVVFEKSRGVGGRMATRRALAGKLSFDHGAQYFTCRDDRFASFVRKWYQQGLVTPWNGRIVSWDDGVVTEKGGTERFVAVPGMNAVAKSIAQDIKVVLNCRVAPPRRCQNEWLLTTTDGDEIGRFDLVVLSAPAGQTADLLSAAPSLAASASQVVMSGCWSVMLGMESSMDCDFDAAFVTNSPLSWIARNSSKPGSQLSTETWVLHASPVWTEQNLGAAKNDVEASMLQEFGRIAGTNPGRIAHQDSHLWRFALPEEPLAESCLFDDSLGIGACGDWCGGPRVEGAFLSGISIGERILQSNATTSD